MLLWVFLLALAPGNGKIETAPKPLITLSPPWTPVFQGDTVLLTCRGLGFYAEGKTKWYRFHWYKQETQGNTLTVSTSGEYTCKIQDSPLSSPVRLHFHSGPLILQAPHSVFEGDPLVVRCQTRGKKKLKAAKYYQNGKLLSDSNETLQCLIPQASSSNSGSYHCIGYEEKNYLFKSTCKIIKIQELFTLPDLKATTSHPTEGNSVNLSCQTQLHPQRLDTPLHFSFFRDNRVILSDWSRSPEFQMPRVSSEDSGWYWCEARAATLNVSKRSSPLQIRAQRVPVSGVLMTTWPPGEQVVEGERLVLVCSVAEGTGNTTFSWHRENMTERVGRTSQHSQTAEMQIPVFRESDAGIYYCTADNGFGSIQSEAVHVTVRKSLRYKSDLVAGGVSGGLLITLLLPAALLLYIWRRRKSGPSTSQSLNPRRCTRPAPLSAGDVSGGDTTRTLPTPGPGESLYVTCNAPLEMQLFYENVHPKEGNLVYSEIQTFQLGEKEEHLPRHLGCKFWQSGVIFEGIDSDTARTPSEYKDASVVYSEVKMQLSDDSPKEVNSNEDDSMENY